MTLAHRGMGSLVLLALLLAGCAGAAAQKEWRPCARIDAPEIDECSGVVRSWRYADVFWVNNDSGDLPRLFALNRQGHLIREVRIEDARNVDWEEVTRDDSGHLYIGDFGNNRNERQDLVVYVVREPDPRAPGEHVLSIPLLRKIPFYFPEQRAFPDLQDFNYDCEAMFWDAGNLYLLTKHRSDTSTVLYRLSLQGDSLRAAVRIGATEIGSQVTAAALSEDGRYLVVLSYQYIDVFERPAVGDDFLAQRRHRLVIEGRQCEGICFDGQEVLFTNEQREIYCLSLKELLSGTAYLPTPPVERVAAMPSSVDGTSPLWARIRPLPMQVEPDEKPGSGGTSTPPVVRLGWCSAGLLLHVTWQVPTVDPGTLLLTAMFGPPGEAVPKLQQGQQVWQVEVAQKGVAVKPLHRESTDATPGRAFLADSPLELEVLLPATLEAGASLLLNVIVADLAVPGREWSWAGSRSTQPEANPLLWGRVVLRP